MSTVYTDLIWSAIISATGVTDGPVVPAGYRWVVTDINLWLSVTAYTISPGFSIRRFSDTTPLWEITRNDACGNRAYHWTGRQVLEAGDTIYVFNSLGTWQMSITGFKLKLP